MLHRNAANYAARQSHRFVKVPQAGRSEEIVNGSPPAAQAHGRSRLHSLGKGKYLLTKSGAAEVERKKLHATDT